MTLPPARLVRALLLATVAAACCAAPAFATVSEPNGMVVPVPSNGQVQLSDYFTAVGEPLSATADAHTAPATFYLLPGGTVTFALHQAGSSYALAWYNAGAGLTPPSGSDLHTLIPGGALQASVSTDAVRASPYWAGGPIGLALVGSQTHYTEAGLNQMCLTCSPSAPWVPAIVYRSAVTAGKFYVAFEDGAMTSSAFNNDGDFNDDVYSLTGVGAACQDTVDNDADGTADAADRGCYSGPGGAYAPGDDNEADAPAAPAVALDAPATDATMLSARITSEGTGRAACAFRLDGGAPITASIDGGVTPARCTAAVPTGLAAGAHALTVTYTETAGTTAQDAGTLTISASTPIVTAPPTAPAPVPAPAVAVTPAVAGLHLSPATFRAARSGASATTATAATGTRVSETLNIAETVRFTVQRATTGRSVSGHCVKATSSNRKHKACTRFVTVSGSFTRTRPAGADRFTFTGRLSGHALTPASYRLIATPTTNGHTGTARHVGFHIVK